MSVRNIASEREKELINEVVNLRTEQNISQSRLVELTGNKQQAISRMEKNEHSPSLKLKPTCILYIFLGWGNTICNKKLCKM